MDAEALVEQVDPGADPGFDPGFDPEALDRAIERILAEDEERNSIAARIDRVASIRRQQSTLAARELTELAELWQLTRAELPANATGTETDRAWRSLAAELAVASRVSDRTMTTRLNDAYNFTENFPSTLNALRDGTISLSHARIIVDNGIQLDDADTRTRYENAMIERAATLTPGRLTRIARHAAEQLTTTSLTERHQAAREQRRITKHDHDNGMSEIIALLPTPLAEAIYNRLTSQTKTLHDGGDPRTHDQLRADLATELLLTGEPNGCPDAPHSAANGIRAHISITIPALTLLGHSNEPATLSTGAPSPHGRVITDTPDTPVRFT